MWTPFMIDKNSVPQCAYSVRFSRPYFWSPTLPGEKKLLILANGYFFTDFMLSTNVPKLQVHRCVLANRSLDTVSPSVHSI